MAVLLSFSLSLDGYIAGPDVAVERPMGRGGERLHEWLFAAGVDHVDAEVARDLRARVGATIVGRRTFDVGLPQWEDVPFPAPAFVVTHEPRAPLAMKSGAFTFVTDGVAGAIAQARAAAGKRDVIVLGAHVAQQCLATGLADELRLQLVPVLLGAGTRLFEDGAAARGVELVATRVVASPAVTHLTFALPRG